ncbi:MAG: ArgR family transcriptional regulator [Oscillospiraceae bacterium]|nr:ArgR family transcriptional regulator [Oscillospiraceae bacterium]
MKRHRQNKIIEIIGRYEITTQDALKKRLEDEGIVVTQATLSRDINELDLRKELSPSGAYVYVRVQRPAVQCPPIFRDSVAAIDYALNTVVIKCHTGMAQAACAVLDKMDCSEIVGTIAGDDTIFALMRSEAAACEFADGLKAMLSED